MLNLTIARRHLVKFNGEINSVNHNLILLHFTEIGPNKSWAVFHLTNLAVKTPYIDFSSLTIKEGRTHTKKIIIPQFRPDPFEIAIRYLHPIRSGKGLQIRIGIDAPSYIKIEYKNRKKD
jgi:hypothetical protein